MTFNWLDKTLIEFDVPKIKRKEEKIDPIDEAIKECADKMTWVDDKDDIKAYAESIKILAEAKRAEHELAIKNYCESTVKKAEKNIEKQTAMFKLAEVIIGGTVSLAGIILMVRAEEDNFLPPKTSNLVTNLLTKKK